MARERAIVQHKEEMAEMEHEEVEEPQMNVISTIILLIVDTVLVGFIAEWYGHLLASCQNS